MEFQSPSDPVDLTNCDREPIHLLGHVQSFGCLIAVSSDWIVTYASQNVEKFLGFKAEDILGTAFGSWVNDKAIHAVRSRLQLLTSDDSVERIFSMAILRNNDAHFDIALHKSGRHIVMEFEPNDHEEKLDRGGFIRPLIERLKTEDSIVSLCETAARHIRALTGFDRVMVYKFHPDDTGEVIAESAVKDIGTFLGLRYPATDIPKQARELYRRNTLRIISDVNDKVSPIIPERRKGEMPLDLSLSGLRAVSPIHIEYLKNMGVGASLSISILKGDKLWGLFACHHYSPRVLNYETRTAAELFGQMFSFLIEQQESAVEREESRRARKLHDQIMGELAEGATLSENFEMIASALKSVIDCDGVALTINGNFQATGSTPTKDEFNTLMRYLNRQETSKIFATDSISSVHQPAEDYVSRAAGLLALPVSRVPRDYIVLFRKEITKEVNWAGNPEKPVTIGPNGIRLTPRKSFEAWKEVVSGHSDYWTDGDIAAAESLRVTLLEVVLRMSDAANVEREKAQERQELLIAELNHRVRNILNLIRGLISQSKSETADINEFTEIIGGRIYALARAHDQLTRESWDWSPLTDLITTEMEAYLGAKSDRVQLNGPNVMLKPEAFTTLSLVIHELTTNSAKYGSLSDSNGEIQITLSQEPDGSLRIAWRESGGPAVKAPTRKGFGTTVIERSIPYELKGKVDLHYKLSGFEADIIIPESCVKFDSSKSARQSSEESAKLGKSLQDDTGLPERALVLDDNMIIALDAEETLLRFGAREVEVVASVSEALDALERSKFDFAILDINLGDETSDAVAKKAIAMGMPFVFVTGYGESSDLLERYNDPVIIQKPFDSDALRSGILKAVGSQT